MNQEQQSSINKSSKRQYSHLLFPNEQNFLRICDKLQKCKSTLLLCIYQLTHQTIIDILIELSKSGCKVDIVMDQNSDELEERKQMVINKLLVMSGFKVNLSLFDGKGLMHTKFCVIDDKLTILGSANWTYQGFQNNFEHLTIFKDTKTAKLYTEQFGIIWNQAKSVQFNLDESQYIYKPNQNDAQVKTQITISNKQTFKKTFIVKQKKKKLKKNKKQQEKITNSTDVQIGEILEPQNQTINQPIKTKIRVTIHSNMKEFFKNLNSLNTDNPKMINQINREQLSYYPYSIQDQILDSTQLKKHKKEPNTILIDDDEVYEIDKSGRQVAIF